MLSEKSIRELRQVLEPSRVLTDPDELLVYEIDAAQDRGAPDGVAFPLSADEVAGLARWSRLHGIPLISRGAGTGLSGGAVAEHGGLIVEFSRLNRILELDAASRGALLEPGVITQTFDERTQALGLYYPPDPSSGRASTLGGNVGENAGGPHCFKYGVTTNYITGLEVVLADGSRLRLGGRALDYPEYDFNSLLVGSEGTLGLVTQIYTRLLCKPAGVKTLMAAFDSVEQAGRAVSAVIAAGLIPATLELMDQKIARIVEDFAHPGIPTQAGALLIVEVDGYPASLAPQMEEIAASIREHGGFDLRIAQTAAERDRIWYARKSAAGAMARLAPAYLLLD
ncbi:MAG TPA: FAD-binding protein, partial [Anaerolineales bacterium]